MNRKHWIYCPTCERQVMVCDCPKDEGHPSLYDCNRCQMDAYVERHSGLDLPDFDNEEEE